MIIDRNGNIIDAVQVPDGSAIFECFRVRVILETLCKKGYTVKKEVIGEEDFTEFPNEQQIMYCIAKYHGDFATIEKIYVIQVLPFSSDESE